jgi:hypothetical protein
VFDTDSRRRTIVHVWTSDGTYVGEVYADSRLRLEVNGADGTETTKIRTILTDLASKTDWIEVRAADLRRAIEFPGSEWLALASLIVLPREGYRVHIISEAVQDES